MTFPSKNIVIAEREKTCGYDDQDDSFVVEQTGRRVAMYLTYQLMYFYI